MAEVNGLGSAGISAGCDEPTLAAYGSPLAEEGRRLVAVPEGWVFTAAKPDSLIIGLLDGDGNLQWQRSMSFVAGRTERAKDMILTYDGQIVVCGYTGDGTTSTWENFVFQYDYQNISLSWARVYSYPGNDNSIFAGILQHPTNGNYIIVGDDSPNSAPGSGCDAVWLEIKSEDGDIAFARNFNLGSCEDFLCPILASDGSGVYVTGRLNASGGGQNRMRQNLSKLDLDGNELWSRLYLRNVSSQDARLYGSTCLEDDDGIFAYGHGDLYGISTVNTTLQFFKTNLQGQIQWAKVYDLPGAQSESAVKALLLPDGFLLTGNFIQGNQDIFLIKINKNGEAQWAKRYGGAGTDVVNDIALRNGQIFLIGATNSFGSGDSDMLLIRLNSSGELLNMNCNFSAELNPDENLFSNPYDGLHPLTAWTPNYPSNVVSTAQGVPVFDETQLCFIPCADTCANGLPLHSVPDAVLSAISAGCMGGATQVSLEVCNADSVALPAGTPISFYPENPTTSAVAVLATLALPTAVAPGDCETFVLPVSLPLNLPIFAMVNDNGSTPTPFNPDADFPNTATAECDFFNNIGSFILNDASPVLNLGSDIILCEFEPVELDAGSGFISYQWSVPGQTGQTFTALASGAYSVTATDACGATHTDEISIALNPSVPVEIEAESAIFCAGDTLYFSAGGFSSYQWFPAELVDCPSCPEVVVAHPIDTFLVLVASDAAGCFSSDSLYLHSGNYVFSNDTTWLCAGDSALVFGNWETQPGIYSQTFNLANGCDSTVQILLLSNPMDINFETTIACPFAFDGEVTALVSGGTEPYHYAWENSASNTDRLTGLDVGFYALTVTDAAGCAIMDSVYLDAAQRPAVSSQTEDVRCFGESNGILTILADDPHLQFKFGDNPIGGQKVFENLPSGGDQFFTIDTFGCIWENFFFIGYPERIVLDLPRRIEAPRCDSVQIEARASGSGLSYSWSPADFLSCTDCPEPVAAPFSATVYHLIVSDANGCTASDSVLVEVDLESKIYIPNAFSPNADGINDMFYALGDCLREIQLMRIFDRWGEKVFEKEKFPANDSTYGWDGRFRNQPAAQDVYIYYIRILSFDGEIIEFKGDLSLLR